MTPESGSANSGPDIAPVLPDRSDLAEPRHAAQGEPDVAAGLVTGWSEPTLIQAEDEALLPAAPEPPARVPRRSRMQYEQGSVASWRPDLIEGTADVALAAMPIPLRVLDVGCGDGRLLAELILRVPHADLYVGVDPLPDVITPEQRAAEPRLSVVRAVAEALPFADASFDLVVATMSFAFWTDQRAGAHELARVVTDNGRVIVVESARNGSAQRNRARNANDITRVLEAAGLQVERTETLRRSALRRPMARAFIASL
jgi:SAM-dependent methyltransferase